MGDFDRSAEFPPEHVGVRRIGGREVLTLWGEPVSRVYWVLGTCISGWAAWSLLQKGPSLLGFLCLVGTAGFVAAGAIGVSFLAYDPKAKELLRGRSNWLGSRLQLESARILGVAVVARYAFEGGNRVQNWGACLLTDGQAVWLGPLQSDQNRAESEADRVASELGLGRVDPSMIDQCSGGTLLLEFPSRLQSLLSFSAAFTSGFAIVAGKRVLHGFPAHPRGGPDHSCPDNPRFHSGGYPRSFARIGGRGSPDREDSPRAAMGTGPVGDVPLPL